MSSPWKRGPSMPSFHHLSQESESPSRSTSPLISELKVKGRVQSPSYTSETDPTWRFRRKYDCVVVEDSIDGFYSEEGEGEEVSSGYYPKNMTCVDYFFMKIPEKRPLGLDPCGEFMCPVCTEEEAERAAKFAAKSRAAPGSGLAGARRPLKNKDGAVPATIPGRSSRAASVGTSLRSKGRKGGIEGV